MNLEKLNLVDIGANLTHKSFKNHLPAILSDAFNAGCKHIVITGTNIPNSKAAIALCRKFNVGTATPKLYCTVGIHPHDASTVVDVEKTKKTMRTIIQDNLDVVVALGECGLDYHRHFSPLEKQKEVFNMQLELSEYFNLPFFLHERSAFADFKVFLEKFHDISGVVHCFTGERQEMQEYLKMGMFIGLTGFICDPKRAKTIHQLIKYIPRDRLMIETDAPFMAPKALKIRNNEPQYLVHVAAEIAKEWNTTVEDVSDITYRNTSLFFNFEKSNVKQVRYPGTDFLRNDQIQTNANTPVATIKHVVSERHVKENRINKLTKKLNEIAILKARQLKGDTLEHSQISKIEHESIYLKELASLELK
ncbi:hypothetical protein HDV02_005394 [Globomyces sp. JEL0801]|nr:hypothetical protein HDV02_005394 [Globomyces sp. JEL0801]